MPILPWRCHQSTNTTGTGALVLNPAANGRRSFADAFNGITLRVPYVIQGASFYEMGYGDFDGGSPGVLARSAVIASSAGGALVSLPVGTADVFAFIDPFQRAVLLSSTDVTLTTRELGNCVVWAGTAAGSVFLPTTLTVPVGMGFLVKSIGTATLTVTPQAGELIDGAGSLALAPLQGAEVMRVGSAWVVIARVYAGG